MTMIVYEPEKDAAQLVRSLDHAYGVVVRTSTLLLVAAQFRAMAESIEQIAEARRGPGEAAS